MASARVLTPSAVSTAVTWALTVPMARLRSRQICLLDLPSSNSRKTSICRAVRPLPDRAAGVAAATGAHRFRVGAVVQKASGGTYCVFGQVPASEEAAVMRRILEVNLALVRQRRAGFGLDAYTNELTYAFVVPSTVAATPLLATMTDIARQAHEWRKNYYLASRPAPTDGAIDLLAQFA